MKYFPVIVLALAFISCSKIKGEGPVVKEERAVVDFSAVQMNMQGEVLVRKANDFKVEVLAQENLLPYIQTYKSGNTLVIKVQDDKRISTSSTLKLIVSAPVFNSLRLSGSGNIFSTDSLTSPAFNLDLSGSGNISLAYLATPDLKANISGSGNTSLNDGLATDAFLTNSGSGNFYLKDFKGEKVKSTSSGSGSIWIHALQTLDATISGSGSVYYKGTPVVTTTISGSGRVKKI